MYYVRTAWYNIRDGKTYLYDKHKPLFAFGHGLSYTTFEYSNLKINQSTIKNGETVNIAVDVKNTGAMNSDEVIQVYVDFSDSKVSRPIKALKAFKRVNIPAGQSITVTLPLKADELKYWNDTQHAFVLEPGKIKLSIGSSSEDIKLTGELIAK